MFFLSSHIQNKATPVCMIMVITDVSVCLFLCQDCRVFSDSVLWWEGSDCGGAEARCQRGGQFPVDESSASGKSPHHLLSNVFILRQLVCSVFHTVCYYPTNRIALFGFLCRLSTVSTRWASTAWLWSQPTPYLKHPWAASTSLTPSSSS